MIGIDGWVEDVVLRVRVEGATTESRLKDLMDNALFRDRIVLLHLAYYGTKFGGGIEAIEPPNNHTQAQVAPNLSIAPMELEKWVLDPQTLWRDVEQPDTRAVHWTQESVFLFTKLSGKSAYFLCPAAQR